jgi:hypothetical protein
MDSRVDPAGSVLCRHINEVEAKGGISLLDHSRVRLSRLKRRRFTRTGIWPMRYAIFRRTMVTRERTPTRTSIRRGRWWMRLRRSWVVIRRRSRRYDERPK